MRAIHSQREESILHIGNDGDGYLPKDPLSGEAASLVLNEEQPIVYCDLLAHASSFTTL